MAGYWRSNSVFSGRLGPRPEPQFRMLPVEMGQQNFYNNIQIQSPPQNLMNMASRNYGQHFYRPPEPVNVGHYQNYDNNFLNRSNPYPTSIQTTTERHFPVHTPNNFRGGYRNNPKTTVSSYANKNNAKIIKFTDQTHKVHVKKNIQVEQAQQRSSHQNPQNYDFGKTTNLTSRGSGGNFMGMSEPINPQQPLCNNPYESAQDIFYIQTVENVVYKHKEEWPHTTVARFAKRNNIAIDFGFDKVDTLYLCTVFFNQQSIGQGTGAFKKEAKRHALASVLEELNKHFNIIQVDSLPLIGFNYFDSTETSMMRSSEKFGGDVFQGVEQEMGRPGYQASEDNDICEIIDLASCGSDDDNSQGATGPTDLQQPSANSLEEADVHPTIKDNFFIPTIENVMYKHQSEPLKCTISRFTERNNITLNFSYEKVGYNESCSIFFNEQLIGKGIGQYRKTARKKACVVVFEELKKYFNIIEFTKGLPPKISSNLDLNERSTPSVSNIENIASKKIELIGPSDEFSGGNVFQGVEQEMGRPGYQASEDNDICEIIDLASCGSDDDNSQGATGPTDLQQPSANSLEEADVHPTTKDNFFIPTIENVVYKHQSEQLNCTISRFTERNNITLNYLYERVGNNDSCSVLFNGRLVAKGMGYHRKNARRDACALVLEELQKFFKIIQFKNDLPPKIPSNLDFNEKSTSIGTNVHKEVPVVGEAIGLHSDQSNETTRCTINPADVQQSSVNCLEKTDTHAATQNKFLIQFQDCVVYKQLREQPHTTVSKFANQNNIKLECWVKNVEQLYLCSIFLNNQLIGKSLDRLKKKAKKKAYAAALEEMKKYIKIVQVYKDFPINVSSGLTLNDQSKSVDSSSTKIGSQIMESTSQSGEFFEDTFAEVVEKVIDNVGKLSHLAGALGESSQGATETTDVQSSVNSFTKPDIYAAVKDAFFTNSRKLLCKLSVPPQNTVCKFAKINKIPFNCVVENFQSNISCSIFFNKKCIAKSISSDRISSKYQAYAAALEGLRSYFGSVQANNDSSSSLIPTNNLSSNMDRPDNEILQSESSDKGMSQNNVGSKIMKLMGWSGGGLGKHSQGITEPINVQRRKRRIGLGLAAEAKNMKKLKVTSALNENLTSSVNVTLNLEKKSFMLLEQPETTSCDIGHSKPIEVIDVLDNESFVMEPTKESHEN
ncbi:uncharacterized protein LOC106647675 [Copidosoma floridanum]|uniref:uncharacterized protein LOC106647675 n=1 Tax=Copidosoma floridanum TaxID=29053 RepID=UPI0006C9D30E|nr:uncharacterized protein LOC106647675 [Copidosoma floridanum]